VLCVPVREHGRGSSSSSARPSQCSPRSARREGVREETDRNRVSERRVVCAREREREREKEGQEVRLAAHCVNQYVGI
jgi:hypothetical protein